MVQFLCKTAWWFLTKLNILFPHNAAITLLGTYPKAENLCPQTNLYMFIARTAH